MAAPAAPAAPVVAVDLEALLLAIVAEKTGYPAEMLNGEMALEADLGIDSIKRVEILSAMRERAPGLREVKPAELATLRTLGQIVDHMRAHAGVASPVAAAPVAAPKAPHGIRRFAVREVAAPAVGMALAGLYETPRLVVTHDGSALAEHVVRALAARGIRASVVSAVPVDATGVIFLGGMRAMDAASDAMRINREAFVAARTVAPRFATEGGVFVTVQDTGGDFGLGGRAAVRAWSGGISALARTAALEWPAASVKAIDCERGARDDAAVAEAIAGELVAGGTTLEVGLHADGARTTLASVEAAAGVAASPRLAPGAVVVASGGARGVTAAALIALAKARKPRLVLLGRTALAVEPAALAALSDEVAIKRALVQRAQSGGKKPVPSEISDEVARVLAGREVRATLAAIEAAGSEVRYVAVDVQSASAIAAALGGIRSEWGPIRGVVHGAGVLADKRIADKTDAQFDRVFDTKVAGLRALLEATAGDPLEALVLFSSIAARTGNPGQCDYAMANEVLNLVACAEHARRGDACAVRSIGWGPWEGGMVTPALRSHFGQMGVALIPLDVGARILVDEISGSGDDVTLVVGGATGEGPLGASAAATATVDVHVDVRSHAYLADHAIAQVPVVPMALVAEWFLRGAKSCRPDLVPVGVRALKVLRGVRLSHFHGEGDRFSVRCRQTEGGVIAVELRGRGDALHYSAMVDVARGWAQAPAALAAPTLEGWGEREIYDGHVLFHGPDFRVVRSVEGVGREGIAGTLEGVLGRSWPAEPWRCDPAVIDGGLQLALLWCQRALGGAVLPMALAELSLYAAAPLSGAARCVVRARAVDDARAVADLVFIGEGGAVVAQLKGLELVLRPADPVRVVAAAEALG